MTTTTKYPTIALMMEVIESTLATMNLPLSNVVERANVEWTNKPKKDSVIAVYDLVRKTHDLRADKVNQIIALGGTADITMTHKQLVQLLGELKVAAEEQQTTTNEKVENTMENKQTAAVAGITQEQLNASLAEVIKAFNTTLNGTIEVQAAQTEQMMKQVTDRMDAMDQRMDKAAKYTQSLEGRMTAEPQVAASAQQVLDPQVRTQALVDAINGQLGFEAVTVYTDITTLENMAANMPAPVVIPKAEEPQYTPDQLKQLEEVKDNPTLFEAIKGVFDSNNSFRMKTFGTIHNVADQVDKYGHSGVDGFANLLDYVVDSLATLTHGVVGVAKEVGHVGVNAVSGTIRFTGDVIKPSENK